MSYVPIPNLQARALPASGTYYTSATAVAIEGQMTENHEGEPTIDFRVTYTAGASGGYPIVRVAWLTPDASGNDVEMYDPITIADPATGVCTTYRATNKLTLLTDGSSTSTDVTYTVPRYVTKVRFEPAEFGNTGTPGTITVAMFGRL